MTLFIAVVIMGILLFISFAVINITLKATLFASSGRDSQYAFYAADAGIECAIYWDSKFDKFATSTSGASISCANPVVPPPDNIVAGQTIPGNASLTLIGGGGDADQTSIFYFTMNQGLNPVPYCAIVTVKKYYDGSPKILKTYIKSKGYNTCDTFNSRRVERGIEVTY